MILARALLTIESLMGKRLPTAFGLGVLVLGVIGGVLLVGQGTGGFLPRASAEHTPQQVRVTNISDTGFSVSFTTQQAASGAIQFGSEAQKTDLEIIEDRDQLSGEHGLYQTHHITVKGLQPQTQYYFRIVTQERQIFENNGQPFAVRTARTTEPASARSAYGAVLNQAGNPATGSLIYLTAPGGSPLSAYVKSDGSWGIPLAQLRTLDLSSLLPVEENTLMSVQVVGSSPSDVLNFSIPLNQMSPVETLQFGAAVPEFSDAAADQGESEPDDGGVADNSSDNSVADDPLSDLPEDELADLNALDALDSSGSFSDLLSGDDFSAVPESGEVTIRFPSEEAEVVSTTKPELAGDAPPGVVLQIEVHSETPYYGVAESDDSGNWNWTPPSDLEPGEHTVTVTYTDENGEQQRITRNFLVLADSSIPSFVSTPSGALVSPKPSPRPSPVPSPRPSPKPSPVPSPVPSKVATSSATLPVSGSTLPFVAFGVGAAVLLGTGMYARRWIPERRS